jgi:nicotinamidase-related amidase
VVCGARRHHCVYGLRKTTSQRCFFGGVNAHQCVGGTLLDALQRYDIVLVYVDDVSATTSLEYAAQMERYNAEENDF